MSRIYNVAIDGPAGAGKSTIAKKVSARLGFVYVDTGAMYRAMALYFLRKGIGAGEEDKISQAAQEVRVTIAYEDGAQQVILNGENVSALIRTEQVGAMASRISVYLPVREKLLQLQQGLAKKENVIMDGRDIGTCVLPGADLKIYLTADIKVRARRRFSELQEKGLACNLKDIEEEIEERDFRDKNREHSPLKKASDAVCIDTSRMDIGEVANRICTLAIDKGMA